MHVRCLTICRAPVLETTGPASRKRAPRKKLSLSLLQDSKGIPDVQNNFYASMKSMFRGKGHEISDTRRLLELYKRWNDRVLPSSGPNDTFDTFIAETEKLSSAGEVKHMMNNKREELLEFALDASKLELGDPIEPLVVDGGNQTDEDELMDLAMTNDDHGTNNEQSIDHNDDEMLALVEAGDEQGTNAEPAELQDDELLDLLFEH